MCYRAAAMTVFVLLIAVVACTKVKYQPTDSSRSYEPAEEIIIYRNYPDVSYEEIGTFRAVGRDKDKLLASIVKQAQAAGAEALVVKPVAVRSNEYESQRSNKLLGNEEYIMEAVALRFKQTEN